MQNRRGNREKTMENIFETSFVGSPQGLMNYIRSLIPNCSYCNDTGIITRTEWSDEDGRDMDYEVTKRCSCTED